MGKQSSVTDLPRAWLISAMRGEAPVWANETLHAAEHLLQCANDEGVTALIHASGATAALPAPIAQAFADAARSRIATELLDQAELVRVLRALAADGVPVLLLKGAALACSVYPAPHLRPRVDVDLLFPDRTAIERALTALAPLGYQSPTASTATLIGYEVGLHRTTASGYSHHLDLHWKLANQAIFADALRWDELIAAAIPLPALDRSVRALSPVHALMYACLHRIAHLAWDLDSGGHGDRLIWLYDFHLLAHRLDADDFRALQLIATERGLAGACLDGLSAAQQAFHTALPNDLLEALSISAREEKFDVSAARRRWYQEWHNLHAMPARQRLAFMREKLFPHAAYMRELYGVNTTSGLAWAYVRRLAAGVRMTLFGLR